MGQDDYVWVASSLGGNPISTVAARAALGVLGAEGVYEGLHRLGKYLRAGMRDVLASRQVTAQIIGDGPLGQIVFTDVPVRDYRTSRSGNPAQGRKLMLALFSLGVFLNPMGTKLYLSLAHDEAVCDRFLDRFDDALARVV
jgi:glutamate-1-semialdehyde 2,1-aminomutase